MGIVRAILKFGFWLIWLGVSLAFWAAIIIVGLAVLRWSLGVLGLW